MCLNCYNFCRSVYSSVSQNYSYCSQSIYTNENQMFCTSVIVLTGSYLYSEDAMEQGRSRNLWVGFTYSKLSHSQVGSWKWWTNTYVFQYLIAYLSFMWEVDCIMRGSNRLYHKKTEEVGFMLIEDKSSLIFYKMAGKCCHNFM